MWNKLGEVWCRLMHESPMWPIHGQYECRTCRRRYPVVWENSGSGGVAGRPMAPVSMAGGEGSCGLHAY
jgi:hypothetical protein